MRLKNIIIIISVVLLGLIYYFNIENSSTEKQISLVTEITDGDTFVLENNVKCRLRGINTPEKNMPLYETAKKFLEIETKNKRVEIENFGADKYNRLLIYAFIDEKNINKLILKNGLAHLYYYDKDKYFDELEEAEKFARENEFGIWKKSNISYCIELIEFDYISDGGEKIVLENNCDFNIEVILKDEATHIYFETLNATSQFEKSFEHIFNDDGDTLFVWDECGRLILFRRY